MLWHKSAHTNCDARITLRWPTLFFFAFFVKDHRSMWNCKTRFGKWRWPRLCCPSLLSLLFPVFKIFLQWEEFLSIKLFGSFLQMGVISWRWLSFLLCFLPAWMSYTEEKSFFFCGSWFRCASIANKWIYVNGPLPEKSINSSVLIC